VAPALDQEIKRETSSKAAASSSPAKHGGYHAGPTRHSSPAKHGYSPNRHFSPAKPRFSPTKPAFKHTSLGKSQFKPSPGSGFNKTPRCFTCGKYGHTASTCNSKEAAQQVGVWRARAYYQGTLSGLQPAATSSPGSLAAAACSAEAAPACMAPRPGVPRARRSIALHPNQFSMLADTVKIDGSMYEWDEMKFPHQLARMQRSGTALPPAAAAWHAAMGDSHGWPSDRDAVRHMLACLGSPVKDDQADVLKKSTGTAAAAAPAAAAAAQVSDANNLDALTAAFKARDLQTKAAGSEAAPKAAAAKNTGPKGKNLAADDGADGAAPPCATDGSSMQRVTAAAAAAGACMTDELMLSRAHFDALQNALVSPCTIDACAAADGSNALLPDFCSKGDNSFFARNFADGDMLFIHPPRTDREMFLLAYKTAKDRCPGIGACILLPAKYSSPLLKGMKQFTQYTRNTPLFTGVRTGQTVKARCDFVVWVDPPARARAAMTAASEPAAADAADGTHGSGAAAAATHTMQLLGVVAGAHARVLIDSGAEQHNYISARFCVQHGITLRQSKQPVAVNGVAGAAVSAQRCCTLKMRLQGLATQLNFVVIDVPQPFDVILGDAWLKSMQAKLDFASHTCTVHGKGRKPIVLAMDAPAAAAAARPATHPAVLSYVQAKRLCKQPVWHQLVVVKAVDDAAAATVAATSAAGAADAATRDELEDARVTQLRREYPTVFTDQPPHGGSKVQLDFEVIPTPPDAPAVLRPMFRY
jgi:hypothetical protein